MRFSRVSQFFALTVLGSTALARSPADAGVAARGIEGGNKVLSRRNANGAGNHYPSPECPIWTQGGAADDDKDDDDDGNDSNNERSGGRARHGRRLRARSSAGNDGTATDKSKRRCHRGVRV
ncbi:hypothetical protein PspLS_00341 [Pyricularia sp. CBS 133598]|nr:hypothetical protein PspLS_00341 [Pyricularia sp. CBS 133598]